MLSIADNPFLQGLGFAIANSLWQFASLWLVYSIVTYLVHFKSANKYRLAVALQTIGFAWFLFSFFVSYHAAAERLAIIDALSANGTVDIVMTGGQENGWQNLWQLSMQKISFVLPYLSAAYLLLLLFMIFRFAQGYKQVQILRKHGLQKMDVRMRLFVDKLAAEFNIGRKVKVYLSELVNSPVTVGFLKPIILVPIASFNQLTTYQLEAVLLHELAHIKRYDYVVHVCLRFIETILFFNPFMQLMSKEIQKERENCCDDWVLQYQYQPADYAAALLSIAKQAATPALAMAANGKSKKHLLERIKRIVQVDAKQRFNYREQLLSLGLLTCIICLVSWYKPVKDREKMIEKVKTIDASKFMVKKENGVFEISVNALAELQKALPNMKADLNKALQELGNVKIDFTNENVNAVIEEVPDKADDVVCEESTKETNQDAAYVTAVDEHYANAFEQAKAEVQKAKAELSRSKMDEQLKKIQFFNKVELGNSMNALMTQLNNAFKKIDRLKINFKRSELNMPRPQVDVRTNFRMNHRLVIETTPDPQAEPVVPMPSNSADVNEAFTIDIDSSLRVYIHGDFFKQMPLRLNRAKTQKAICDAVVAEKRIAAMNRWQQRNQVLQLNENARRNNIRISSKINGVTVVELKVNEKEETSTEVKIEDGK
jgi:beta-lactamase regulating signal transducer with metallopeptidase domain